MAINLISTPEIIQGAITSRFVAVANPIRFNFQYSNVNTTTATSFGILNQRVFFETAAPTGQQVGDQVKLTITTQHTHTYTDQA